MPNENIMVSVVLTTYNQEKYIGKAVDSILAQEVSFPMEILIGEDCSTDGTADVLREYEIKYPGRFQVFYREKNLGANRNTYELHIRTKGKYIAGLEGDDYWSDIHKLQKQVDFLESHPEYYSCAHAFSYVDENDVLLDESIIPEFDKRYWYGFRGEFTLQDYMQNRLPAQGGTWVYHNFFLENQDTSIIYKADPYVGDLTYALILLGHGRFWVMDEKMSCYRRNMRARGDSWNASQSRNIYHYYDSFSYFTNLEIYARDILHLKLDLRIGKTPLFYYMMNYFVQKPTLARWHCIKRMLIRTPHKPYYFKLLFKSFYLSTVYPSIRNTDPPRLDEPLYDKVNKTWNDFFEAAEGKEVIVYGAGGGAYDLQEQYYDRLCIKYIVDRSIYKVGKYIYGKRTCGLESLQREDPQNIVILIATGMFYREVIDDLEKMGFNNIFVYQLMELKKWRYKLLPYFDDKDRKVM